MLPALAHHVGRGSSIREGGREGDLYYAIMQKVKDEFNSELEKIRATNAEAAISAAASPKSMKEAHESTLKILLEERDEAMTNKPKTKWSEKLSEKSYKRIDKFADGETTWQDWRYDFELLTGALNPQVAEELKITAKAIAPRTFAEIREGYVLQPQDNWDPELRSKELFEI